MRIHPEGHRPTQPPTPMSEAFARRKNTRDHVIGYNPMRDPLVIQELEKRAREPKAPTHIELNGKMLRPLEYFTALVSLHEKLEREAGEKGTEEIDYSQLPWQPDRLPGAALLPLIAPVTLKQRQERNLPYARMLQARMEKEAAYAQFSEMAATIPEKIWKQTSSPALPIVIRPVKEIRLSIEDDGTVSNRSRLGTTLSYVHEDGFVHVPQGGSLSFGIGYVSDRDEIIPEARAFVSDEQLQAGVKVYYIQRTYTFIGMGTRQQESITYTFAIPLRYQDAQQVFLEYLYASARRLAPENALPQSRRRRYREAA